MFISVSDTFIEHTKTTCMGYRCLRKKRPSHGIRNVMETPPLPPISKLNWLTRLASAKMDVFFADRSTHRSGPCNIELRGCGGHWAALVCQMDVFSQTPDSVFGRSTTPPKRTLCSSSGPLGVRIYTLRRTLRVARVRSWHEAPSPTQLFVR